MSYNGVREKLDPTISVAQFASDLNATHDI